MTRPARGLGKGLGALLGEGAATEIKPVDYINKTSVSRTGSGVSSADIVRIPMDLIEANPFQPRMSFDEEALAELAQSIRTLGLIQPITVRRIAGSRYQIISGERRFRACRMAGLEQMPAYIRQTDDKGMLEMAIVENVQREDLDPIEVALSYRRLIEECHLTQEEMAERVGKGRASVTNYLRLLKLPERVQHDVKVGLLSVGHAKVLLGVEGRETQEKLCEMCVRDGLSVRQLEEKIRRMATAAESAEEAVQELPDNYYKVLEIVGKYFSNRISLKRSGEGRGTMTIHFSSDDEIRQFLEALEDRNL